MGLTLVGVGHVFRIGPQIRSLILQARPNVVCLELDQERYAAILSAPPGPRAMPEDAPRAYRALAAFQQEMADAMGAAEVGGEMREAAKAAQAIGARVELVDEAARDLVDRLRKGMGWWEKLRFLWELRGLRAGPKEAKNLDKELAQLEQNPEKLVDEMGRKFPTLRRVLVDERDEAMARRIRNQAKQNAEVVAVVGDGHIQGVARRLADLKPTVRRLRELRRMPSEAPLDVVWDDGGANLRFGFDAKIP